ncbi:MAG TPA: glycosyltransferase family 39 protein [Gemmatimonadales bacterium]|nr:glycosyltransferase family 39 protein [Gemmatimonadales bacterium]
MSVGTAPGDLRRPGAPALAERARGLLADPALAAVAALTVLGAVLRLYRLGHQGFWFDEGNTALLVHFSPGKMLGLIPQSESTPPLYYCVAWMWARVFGYDEVGLRSLSAVCGVLLVPVVYAAGARLISRRAGVIAAALAACSPLLIWYSQEARSYSMLALLSSVSLLAFAYARLDPSPRVLAAWVVASALALATHYYAALVVVPEALWLLWVHRRRSVQVAVGVVGVCGLGLIPLAIGQQTSGRANWISFTPFDRRFGQIGPQFAAGFDGPAHSVLEPVAIAIVVLALVLLATRSEPVQRRGALLAGGIALSGFLISLVLVVAGFDDLLTRNVLAISAPAALLVAGGLAVPRPRGVGVIAALALCGMGVATAVGVAVDRDYQRPDWRVVAGALGQAPVGGRAILVQHYSDRLPLSLYMPALQSVRGQSAAAVREFDVVSFTAPASSGFCWWGSACNLWPSRMQSSYPIAGLHPVSERHVLQFTVLRMVSSHPVRLSPAAVAGALTATNFRDDKLMWQR